jgi:holliday junction DNA helicase RuvA
MYEFIEGAVTDKSPAHIVLQAGGIGYYIHISLHTYSGVPDSGNCRIYIHEVIREDAHLLYGFTQKSERNIFRQLISVSGIGSNTARLILSSMAPQEIINAILEENVYLLQSIKGIGAKTAQRLIVELKDKVGKSSGSSEFFTSERNTIRDESLNALVALGFQKKQVEKILGTILTKSPALTLEELIKQALKQL